MSIFEVSSEVLTLPHVHPAIGKTIELAGIDHFHIGLQTRFGLAFVNKKENEIDLKKLRQSLNDTLEEYPELTASLKVEKRVSLVHSNKGVRFSVFKSDNIDYEDFIAMKRNETDIFLATKSSFDISNDFLFYIKLTILKDNSYIFGFTISHVLQDAHSNFQFINAWSYRFLNHKLTTNKFGGFGNCEFIERNLLKGHKPSTEVNEYKIMSGESYWKEMTNANSSVFNISKKKLDVLKEEYLKLRSTSDPPFISRNDILCAILFQAITKAREINKHTDIKFGQAVNVRKKLGLNKKFSGNAVVATSVCSTVKEILEMPWWKLAVKIRQDINSLYSEKIKGKLGFLESPDDWSLCRSNFDLTSGDTFFVNWESFPIFESDFGDGKPKKLLYCDWCFALVVLLPVESGNYTEGIINLTKEAIQKVSDDDLVKSIIC